MTSVQGVFGGIFCWFGYFCKLWHEARLLFILAAKNVTAVAKEAKGQ